MDTSITPAVTAEDVYEGGEFVDTPPGTYTMALVQTAKSGANMLRVKKAANGTKKLEVFFKHAEDSASKRYKGIKYSAKLEGVDKNNKPLARQVAELLIALGVEKADAINVANRANGSEIRELESFDSLGEDEQWKGVSAAIVINGDTVDLSGREAIVKVETNTFNGRTTNQAKAVYKAS